MVKKLLISLAVFSALACGLNSVTKDQLSAVKAGDVITYRYQKGGKSWFYADKVTRVEGDKIYFNPSKNESTAGNDTRLQQFETSIERSIAKADLLKYDVEQGDERKVVIWIN